MPVFNLGDLTIYPGVHGGRDKWTGHYSITMPDTHGEQHRVAVTDVPGVFATDTEAMAAAREAGRIRAQELLAQSKIEPYVEDD